MVTPVRAGTVPSLIRDEDSSPQLYARQASVAMTTRITTPSLRRRKGWSSDAAITVKSPIFEEMRSVGGISKVSSSSSENSYDLPLHERTCMYVGVVTGLLYVGVVIDLVHHM